MNPVRKDAFKNWMNYVLSQNKDVPDSIRISGVEDVANSKILSYFVQSVATKPVVLISDPMWSPKYPVQNNHQLVKVIFSLFYYFCVAVIIVKFFQTHSRL